MRLVIYGCGGHGREMVWAARDQYQELAFLTDGEALPYQGIPVLSHRDLREDDAICIAVGDPSTRRKLAEKVSRYRFAKIVAPTAIVDRSSNIERGAQVCDFSFIGSLAQIGRHFQCNVRSHVHHDCIIGDYVTFSPGTLCLGTVHIGNNVFVGAGAVLRNGVPGKPLTIGEDAVVGMGSVVTEDVPPRTTVFGNPARPQSPR